MGRGHRRGKRRRQSRVLGRHASAQRRSVPGSKEGEWHPNPFIVQKSDGGFNYATTDLATLAYRLENWQPQEIIYVTDGRQQLHFQQLFATFRRWHPEAKLETRACLVRLDSRRGRQAVQNAVRRDRAAGRPAG